MSPLSLVSLRRTGTQAQPGCSSVRSRSFLHEPLFQPSDPGISQYTNPSHIARAVLEANAYQTRAIIESMKLDSGTELRHLKVDGGMTNGDLAMNVLADVGGFTVIRPEMREYVMGLLEG